MSGSFHISLQDCQQFLQFPFPFRFRMSVLDAVMHVRMNQFLGKRFQPATRGDDLCENFHAVPIFGKHTLNGVELTRYFPHPDNSRLPLRLWVLMVMFSHARKIHYLLKPVKNALARYGVWGYNPSHMDRSAFSAIALTGFSVAFFHAAIPTHWLPFVLTGRAQKWSWTRTLAVTALAGCGHVLFTALLGFLVAWGGIALSEKVGGWFPWLAGGALIAFGLYYVIQQFRGKGHGHYHLFGGHSHSHAHDDAATGPQGGKLVNIGHSFIEISVFETGVPPRFRLFFYDDEKKTISVPNEASITVETVRTNEERQTFTFRAQGQFLESTTDIPEPHEFKAVVKLSHGDHAHCHYVQFEEHDHSHAGCAHAKSFAPSAPKSDWAAIVSLLALLTFSPCEGFLPVYVSGVHYGWIGFFTLTAILSFATVAGMIAFTWLTLVGIDKLNLTFLERYERGILGGLLCLLGVLVIFLEH